MGIRGITILKIFQLSLNQRILYINIIFDPNNCTSYGHFQFSFVRRLVGIRGINRLIKMIAFINVIIPPLLKCII